MENEWPLMLLIAAPAGLALMSLGVAIAIFANAKKPDGQTRVSFVIVGTFLVLVALGIGSCYGIMLFGNVA